MSKRKSDDQAPEPASKPASAPTPDESIKKSSTPVDWEALKADPRVNVLPPSGRSFVITGVRSPGMLGDKSGTTQANSKTQSGTKISPSDENRDHANDEAEELLQLMRKRGIPTTRANYLELAYGKGCIPKPWTREHESGLPAELQNWKQFKD